MDKQKYSEKVQVELEKISENWKWKRPKFKPQLLSSNNYIFSVWYMKLSTKTLCKNTVL